MLDSQITKKVGLLGGTWSLSQITDVPDKSKFNEVNDMTVYGPPQLNIIHNSSLKKLVLKYSEG